MNKKMILSILLAMSFSLVAFLPQCSSSGGDGDAGGDTTPIAVLYQVGSMTSTKYQGDLDGKSFGICDESNAPALLKASNGYMGHTFYGSTNAATNGDFGQIVERLGGTGQAEMRLWRPGETEVYSPSTATTLSELVAVRSSGAYMNTMKVQAIFQWMQNGDEASPNTSFNYWAFTDGSSYSSSNNCNNATSNAGGSPGYTGYETSVSGFTGPCSPMYYVFCLARKN